MLHDDASQYHASAAPVHAPTATGADPFLIYAETELVRLSRKIVVPATPLAIHQLMDETISLDRAHAEINRRREAERVAAAVTEKKTAAPVSMLPTPKRNRQQPVPTTAPATDLLTQAIEELRPLLTDETQPTKARTTLLWAAAKNARQLASRDILSAAFMALALETDLINEYGQWAGPEVRDYVRRQGAEDVAHVIAWALKGWNPFEEGRLK